MGGMFWLAQTYAMVFDTQYSTKVVFEHNKFQAMCTDTTQPHILDKWNIVVLNSFLNLFQNMQLCNKP